MRFISDPTRVPTFYQRNELVGAHTRSNELAVLRSPPSNYLLVLLLLRTKSNTALCVTI